MKRYHSKILGGANTHGSKSGVSHFTAEDDQGAIDLARELVDLLPANNMEKPPQRKLVIHQTEFVKTWIQSFQKTQQNPTMSRM